MAAAAEFLTFFIKAISVSQMFFGELYFMLSGSQKFGKFY